MKNSDVFLDESDSVAISEYLDDKEKGKLVCHDEVEKELGL